MRGVSVFAAGIFVGVSVQIGFGQEPNIVSLNHVAISVRDFDQAANFYEGVMGFPEAFAFRDTDGKPVLSYFQVNRNTFVELMPSSPERPTGFVHFGLEVTNLDSVVRQLRERGMSVRDPIVSPRTQSRIAVARTPEGTVVELLEFGPDSLHRKVMEAWR